MYFAHDLTFLQQPALTIFFIQGRHSEVGIATNKAVLS